MSASHVSVSQSLVENPLAVSFKVLLGLYLIIPLSFLVYLADVFLLGKLFTIHFTQ